MEMPRNNKIAWILLILVIIGTLIRFINFKESIYFGYDEARDAFISQDIFLKGDLKLVGPTISAFTGVYHGPLYYYLLGPLFLLDRGDPYVASAVFRILNAAGIVGVFVIASMFFNPIVGLLSAFLYAFSYEQFIYAIFTGNPSGSNLSWIILFIGAGFLHKYKDKRIQGLTLMFFGASLAAQFDMVLGFSFIVVFLLLFFERENILNIGLKKWPVILGLGLSPLYTYLLAEIKYKFIGAKTLLALIMNKTTILRSGESVWDIFFRNLLGLFRNNILDLSLSNVMISGLLLVTLWYLIFKSRKDQKYLYFVIWTLSFSVLMLAGGFMPMYSYAGVGIGLIIGFSALLNAVMRRNFPIALVIMVFIILSNLAHIFKQSTHALVVEIKAQPDMKLTDEIKIINATYETAADRGFTIRTTTMPYKIQTVWAYLYRQYGLKKNGYLPYLETGNVQGFPGELPVPTKGTTCVRYLIREPTRGIPEHLIIKDEGEENYFSNIVSEQKFGKLVLQTRIAKDPNCHNLKPTFIY